MKYLDIKCLVNTREVDREGHDVDTCFQAQIAVTNGLKEGEPISEWVNVEYRAKLDGVRLDLVVEVIAEGEIWDSYTLRCDKGREFLLKLRELARLNEKTQRNARAIRRRELADKLS